MFFSSSKRKGRGAVSGAAAVWEKKRRLVHSHLRPPLEEGGLVDGEGLLENRVVVNVCFCHHHPRHVPVQRRTKLLVQARKGV